MIYTEYSHYYLILNRIIHFQKQFNLHKKTNNFNHNHLSNSHIHITNKYCQNKIDNSFGILILEANSNHTLTDFQLELFHFR